MLISSCCSQPGLRETCSLHAQNGIWLRTKWHPSSDIQDFSPAPSPQIPLPSKPNFQSISSVQQDHCILFGFCVLCHSRKVELGLLFLSLKDHTLHVSCPILGNSCFTHFVQGHSFLLVIRQGLYLFPLPVL